MSLLSFECTPLDDSLWLLPGGSGGETEHSVLNESDLPGSSSWAKMPESARISRAELTEVDGCCKLKISGMFWEWFEPRQYLRKLCMDHYGLQQRIGVFVHNWWSKILAGACVGDFFILHTSEKLKQTAYVTDIKSPHSNKTFFYFSSFADIVACTESCCSGRCQRQLSKSGIIAIIFI